MTMALSRESRLAMAAKRRRMLVSKDEMGALEQAISAAQKASDAQLLRQIKDRMRVAPVMACGGPIQRLILSVMMDKKVRDWNQMSAAIAAKHNQRIEVGSVHAAVSGMIGFEGRRWLWEFDASRATPAHAAKTRLFQITDAGVAAYQRGLD